MATLVELSPAVCVVAVTPSARTEVAVTVPVKSPVTSPITSPKRLPVSEVEVTLVNPANVVLEAPKSISVVPTVILSFTNWPLVIVVAEIWPAIVSAVIDPPREISWPAMVIPSFAKLEFGTATKSNVNVSVPAVATIFKPVDPEAKFNVPWIPKKYWRSNRALLLSSWSNFFD